MRIRPRLLFALITCALPAVASAQTTYTWQNTNLTWGEATAWSPNGVPNSLTEAIAAFGNVTTADTPNIDTGIFSVRGITFNNTGQDWNLIGASSGRLNLGKDGITWTGGGATNISANLRIAEDQTWSLGSTAVTVSGLLNGYGTITKLGSGTLTLTNANNLFTGAISVSDGTLTIGTSSTGSANAALRNTAVTLSSGATLSAGGTSDLRVGQISGSGGTVNNGTGTINMLALSDATFSGSVTAGGLNLHGTGNQTFNGNTTGLGGLMGINSGATLSLAGSGNSTSGVLGSTGTIALRGGSLVLDNSGGNTSATTGRVSDSNGVTSLGGRLSFVGNSGGSSETLGGLTVNAGNTTINVTSNSTTAETVLTLASFTHANGAGVNFTNTGGTLGESGNNPRIVFGTTEPTVTNGLIIGASSRVGIAIVNGTSFATYDSTNGVRAVADSSLITFGTFGSALNTLLSGSGTTGGSSSNQSVNTITIDPSAAGQSLDINGTGNLNFGAILYRGSRTDYTISSSGGGSLGGSASRTIWVTDANGQLNISAGLSQAVFKSGDGFLSLTNTTNSESSNSVTINAGTLRVVNGSGATSSLLGGLLTLRGGVLEISNGSDGTGSSADFTRSLGTTGTTINWNESATDRGDGGFSAVGANATVSIGGATPTSLTWNSGRFVLNDYALVFGSTQSDSRLRFMNNVSLGTNTSNYFAREIRVIDNASSTGDFASLAGVISGNSLNDLLKTGVGTLELTNANTYAGNTLVHGGQLWVTGQTLTQSGTGTGNVVVMTGATLGSGGYFVGDTFVAYGQALPDAGNSITVLSGGTIRGGNASNANANNGTLGVGDTVIKNGGSLLSNLSVVDGDGNGTSSKLALLGDSSVSVETGSILKLTKDDLFSTTTTGTFVLVTKGENGEFRIDGVAQDDDTVFGTYSNGVASGAVTIDPSALGLNSGANLVLKRSGNDLVLVFTPVPEPASLLAVCGLAVGGFALVRRIRRKAADVTPAA